MNIPPYWVFVFDNSSLALLAHEDAPYRAGDECIPAGRNENAVLCRAHVSDETLVRKSPLSEISCWSGPRETDGEKPNARMSPLAVCSVHRAAFCFFALPRRRKGKAACRLDIEDQQS
jgi:hypothetical protein